MNRAWKLFIQSKIGNHKIGMDSLENPSSNKSEALANETDNLLEAVVVKEDQENQAPEEPDSEDIVSNLPTELIEIIFSYLDTNSLHAAAKTAPRWNSVIAGNRKLTTALETNQDDKPPLGNRAEYKQIVKFSVTYVYLALIVGVIIFLLTTKY